MQKTLKVCGDHAANVKQAVKQLRGAFFQAVARDRASQSQPTFLLMKVKGIDPAAKIEMTHFLASSEKSSGSKTTLVNKEGQNVIGARPRLLEPASDDPLEISSAEDVASISTTLERSLPTLQYFQGNLEMRARLGAFVLRKYRQGDHTFEDFQEMLDDDEVDGAVYSEVDVPGEVMLDRLARNREILNPGFGGYERSDVLELKPTFAVTFLVDARDRLLLKLDVKFAYDEDGNIEQLSRTWSRLPGANPQQTLKTLDMCLINLKRYVTPAVHDIALSALRADSSCSECSAWNIEIKSFDTVNEARGTALAAFSESVSLDLSIASNKSSKQTFVKYSPQPGVRLEALTQKMIWSVEYQHTGYIMDLSEVRQFRLSNPRDRYANQLSLTGYEPTWRIEVLRKEWDVALVANRTLGTGEGTARILDVAKLFPEETGGLPGFVDVLNRFRACVKGA